MRSPRRRAGRPRRRLHGPDRRQVGASLDRAVLCSVRGRAVRAPRARRDTGASRRSGPRCVLRGRRRRRRSQLPAGWTRTISRRIASEWVEPLRLDYRGVEVCELPPNGQGAAALVGLALYDGLEPGLHSQIEANEARARGRPRALSRDGPAPRRFSPPSTSPPGARSSTRRARSTRALEAAARRHDIPLRGRRRRHGGLADPERLRDVRLRGRRPGHRRRPPEPRARGSSRKRAIRIAWRPLGARSTRSSRACCSRGTAARPVRRHGRADAAAGPPPGRAAAGRHGDDPQAALDARAGAWATAVKYTSSRGSGVARTELARARPRRPSGAVQHPFGVGQAILRLGDALIGGSDGRGDGSAVGF